MTMVTMITRLSLCRTDNIVVRKVILPTCVAYAAGVSSSSSSLQTSSLSSPQYQQHRQQLREYHHLHRDGSSACYSSTRTSFSTLLCNSPRGRFFSYYYYSSSSSSSSEPLQQRPPPTYTLALTREVPETFQNAITKYAETNNSNNSSSSNNNKTSIDLQRARDQHSNYVEQLKQLVPQVVVLPPLHHLPDSVFVEDTVVVVDQIAIMTRPGHPSRRQEVNDFKRSLREYAPSTKLIVGEMNMNVADDGDDDGDDDGCGSDGVICDGGDVLYTGRHLFVGLSTRTNRKAVGVLQTAFGFNNDEYKDDDDDNVDADSKATSSKVVVAVGPKAFADDALHLKSVVTAIDSHTLLAPSGPVGDHVLHYMGAYEKGYSVVRLPSMLACNVVSANGGLLAQDGGCTLSRQILQEMATSKGLDLRWVDCSEFAKADGALTCCSVLLNV